VLGLLLPAFFLGAFLSSRFSNILSGALGDAKKGAKNKKDSGRAETQEAERAPRGNRVAYK